MRPARFHDPLQVRDERGLPGVGGVGPADGIVNTGDPQWFLDHRFENYTTAQLPGPVLQQPLIFTPGTHQQYNGVNYTGQTPGYASGIFATRDLARTVAFAFTPVEPADGNQVLAAELAIAQAAYDPPAGG